MNYPHNDTSETEKQSHKVGRCRLADRAFVFALVALVALLKFIMFPPALYRSKILGFIAVVVAPLAAIGGIVLGVKSIVVIKRSERGAGLAGGAILIGVVVLGAVIHCYVSWLANQLVCGMQAKGLAKPLVIYANHFDEYPTPDKWCDLLIKHADVTEKRFVCRGAGKGRCHYAMNPNCEPNSPPDVVLLFETKGGWNQFGGQEILTLENHRGDGCNILFNDGYVKFVRAKRIGELKWE